jgi:hypothetical protein
MIAPAEYDDIFVTRRAPLADIETTLQQWIKTGPGPRLFVTITAAHRRTGEPVRDRSILDSLSGPPDAHLQFFSP